MSQPFNQSFTFKLDKPHLQECFEQSASPVQIKDYFKACVFAVATITLFFIEAEHYYLPFFLFCLFVVELLSIKYRQTWWVWRQLMGKSANGTVEVSIHDEGVSTKSKHVDSDFVWSDVNAIEETDKGILIKHKNGTNYLSKSHMEQDSVEYIIQQSLASQIKGNKKS